MKVKIKQLVFSTALFILASSIGIYLSLEDYQKQRISEQLTQLFASKQQNR